MVKSKSWIVAGFGTGLALMYAFDPVAGRRRRAKLSDKARHGLHEFLAGLELTLRDANNRSVGFVSRARAGLFHHEVPDDDVLIERVRAKIGRVVSHPHAVRVSASNGKITLHGLVLDDEVPELLAVVRATRGVRGVSNQLEPHTRDERVPALQGGRPRPGVRSELMRHRWSPTARVFMGMLGARLMATGLSARGSMGSRLVSSVGMGILVRSLTNLDLGSLIGVGRAQRIIHVHKTVNIDAPVARVFEFWSNFENFTRVMPDVREISKIGPSQYRWSVAGPAGVPLRWDAQVTEFVPNDVIAWQTRPNAIIRNAGQVRFSESSDGGTRLDLDLSYNPPAGAIGHAIATVFGADPRSKMDANLMRVKSLFEVGRVDGQMIENGRIIDVKASELH